MEEGCQDEREDEKEIEREDVCNGEYRMSGERKGR